MIGHSASDLADDSCQYILFEHENKKHLKEDLESLPKQMENPYQILKRFIKWEIMDLEAMIETIEQKNKWNKTRLELAAKKTSDHRELLRLQSGNGSFFMTKNQKINRITLLTERIEASDKEIGCADVLTKIIYLYLQEVAIPFFR